MIDLSEISQRLSDTITEDLNYSEEKKEIVAYGIESLALSIVGFLAILLVALLFNALVPAALTAVFGGLLRKVSGGAHFNSPFKCLAFGAIVYSLLGVMAKQIVIYDLYNGVISLILLAISLVIVGLLAPVDCEAKPIHSESFRRKLKIFSVCFVGLTIIMVVLSNYPLLNTCAVLGIGYQTLTLLPVFNK